MMGVAVVDGWPKPASSAVRTLWVAAALARSVFCVGVMGRCGCVGSCRWASDSGIGDLPYRPSTVCWTSRLLRGSFMRRRMVRGSSAAPRSLRTFTVQPMCGGCTSHCCHLRCGASNVGFPERRTSLDDPERTSTRRDSTAESGRSTSKFSGRRRRSAGMRGWASAHAPEGSMDQTAKPTFNCTASPTTAKRRAAAAHRLNDERPQWPRAFPRHLASPEALRFG